MSSQTDQTQKKSTFVIDTNTIHEMSNESIEENRMSPTKKKHVQNIIDCKINVSQDNSSALNTFASMIEVRRQKASPSLTKTTADEIPSNTCGNDIDNNSSETSKTVQIIKSFKTKQKINSIKTCDLFIKKLRENEHKTSEISIMNGDPIPKCILCKKYYSSKTLMNSGNCKHLFCMICLKQIFESEIEASEKYLYNFKCPLASCDEYFITELILSILSPSYLSYLKGQHTSLRLSFDEIKSLIKKGGDKTNVLSNYNQHNVIDLNTNRDFYYYTQSKKTICPMCNHNKMFNKKASSFLICLNCLRSFCKYCLIECDEKHFVKENVLHCKVFFRNTYKNKLKKCKTYCQPLFLQFFFLIASYVILHLSIITYSYHGINKILQFIKCKCLGKIVSIFFTFVTYFFMMPIFVLIVPYFPLMTIQ